MASKNLKNTFLSKVSRTALTILLPVTMVVSVGLYAMNSRDNIDKEKSVAVPEMQPVAQQAPTLAPVVVQQAPAGAQVRPVVFKEASDTAALVKAYPFLDSVIKDATEMDRSINVAGVPPGNPTQLLVSHPDPTGQKLDLLFVHLSGTSYCGTAGCLLKVYAKMDGNYKKVLEATVQGEMNVSSTKDGKPSLVFCTNEGPQEWVFEGLAFRHAGAYTAAPVQGCAVPQPN